MIAQPDLFGYSVVGKELADLIRSHCLPKKPRRCLKLLSELYPDRGFQYKEIKRVLRFLNEKRDTQLVP